MVQGEDACWDNNGSVAGKWSETSGKIVIQDDSVCGYTAYTGTEIEALLCYSNGNSGISIDLRDGYDADFLSSQFTRNALINTLTLIDLVPRKAVKMRFTQYY